MSAALIEHPDFSFNSALPYNTGLVVLRAEGLREDRTTVVVGTPRGGTSMVAECLAVLGFPMGVPVPPPPPMINFEDPEFQGVLHRTEPGPVDLGRLRELVASRNRQHPRWGFKLPMALNSLALLKQELRNPAFVLVMRDVVGIAARECIAGAPDLTAAMGRALIWQQRMIDFAGSSAAPCLLMSYEKALQFPELAATTLARWAGVSASPEECREAASCIAANRENYVRRVQQVCEEQSIPRPETWSIGQPEDFLEPVD